MYDFETIETLDEFAADAADYSNYTGDLAFERGSAAQRRYDGLDGLGFGAREILAALFDDFGGEVAEAYEAGQEPEAPAYDLTAAEGTLQCGLTLGEVRIVAGAQPRTRRVTKGDWRATTEKVTVKYAETQARKARNKAKRAAAKARKAEQRATEAAAKLKARNTIKVVKHAEPVTGAKAKARYVASLQKGDQLVELSVQGHHGKATTVSVREISRGRKTIEVSTTRTFEW